MFNQVKSKSRVRIPYWNTWVRIGLLMGLTWWSAGAEAIIRINNKGYNDFSSGKINIFSYTCVRLSPHETKSFKSFGNSNLT